MRDIDADPPIYGPHVAPGSDADADDVGSHLPIPAVPAPAASLAPSVDLSSVAFAVFFGNGDTGIVVTKAQLAVTVLVGSALIPSMGTLYINIASAMVCPMTTCVGGVVSAITG